VNAPTSGVIRLPVPKIRCELCGHGDEDNLRRIASRGVWKCRRLQECRERRRRTNLRKAAHRVSRKSKRPVVKDTPRNLLSGNILQPRWALNITRPGKSVDEIAAELGVTRGRVQQIEAKALQKVERAARRLGLKTEDVLGDGFSP
jgi:DNA-directed RNA polymerase sigma subunit (sigma70/sigma32)